MKRISYVFLCVAALFYAGHVSASERSMALGGQVRSAFLYKNDSQEVNQLNDAGNVLTEDGKVVTTTKDSTQMGIIMDSRVGGKGEFTRDNLTSRVRLEFDLHDSQDATGLSITPRDAWVQLQNDTWSLTIGRQRFGDFRLFERPHLAMNAQEVVMGSILGRTEGVSISYHRLENTLLKLNTRIDHIDNNDVTVWNPVYMYELNEWKLGAALSLMTVQGDEDRGGSPDLLQTTQELSLWAQAEYGAYMPYIGLEAAEGKSEDSSASAGEVIKTESSQTRILLGLNYIAERYKITGTLLQETTIVEQESIEVEDTETNLSISYARYLTQELTLIAGLRSQTVASDGIGDNSMWSVTSGLNYFLW